MRGRTENKIQIEQHIQAKIATYPRFVKNYYYSLSSSSHTTKLRYINNLLRFVDYKYPNKQFSIQDIKELGRYDIEEYIDNISFYGDEAKVNELKATTKACILSSLSSFFNFLVDERVIEVSPMERIKRPKIEQGDITYLEPNEVIQIEDTILYEGVGNAIAQGKQKAWRYRDFLLFHIPVINGIRVEALREINMNDIHLNNMCITVTEKGNRTRDVYIDDVAIRYIRMWTRERRELIGDAPDCGALFISNRRTRMTTRSIEKIIQKYADGINGKHITPHKLRSTFGTNAYLETRDIKQVAEGLGHKTTVPTERYVKTFEKRNKETTHKVANLYNKYRK